MKRSIISFAVAMACILGAAPVVLADDAPPTPQQLEAAKKAFNDGKKLHEQGKLPEAIEKFKESYRLSKKPALLYNIALTMEEASMDDLALFYFRKFLAEAPADAEQRPTVQEHVKALEKKFNPGGSEPTKVEPTGVPAKTEPTKVKPAGTYSATDFQHEVVDVAPPGKPLDVTAFVPEDSGFVVTLYYRTAGEGKFTSKTMKWRYKELVGRIPAPKMIGTSVQYYIEVKDAASTLVTKSGKSTSPNLINIEAGATPRFYPDVSDEGDAKTTSADVKAHDDDDDPLGGGKKTAQKDPDDIVVQPPSGDPSTGGSGFRDVGSSKFTYMKWGSTIGAGALLGLSTFFYVQAGNYAKALEDEANSCGSPPCGPFDSYNQSLESTGKSRQTLSRVTLVVGLGAAAIAGYYWYKDLTAKKRGETRISGKTGSPEASAWIVAPSIGGLPGGEGFIGAATAKSF